MIAGFIKYFVPGFLAIITFVTANCHREQPSNHHVAEKLVRFINRYPGVQFNTEVRFSTVESLDRNRYRVTFRNSVFFANLTSLFKVLFRAPFRQWGRDHQLIKINNVAIDEMVVLYTPGENEKECMESLKGLQFAGQFDPPTHPEYAAGKTGYYVQTINFRMSKATFGYCNPQFLSPKNKQNHFNADLDHLILHIDFAAKTGDHLSVTFETRDTIQISSDIGLNLAEYVYNHQGTAPDFKSMLKNGKPLFDAKMSLGTIGVSIRKNELKMLEGEASRILLSMLLTPDQDRSHIRLDYGLELKDFKLSSPGNRKWLVFSRLNELKGLLSIRHMSPDLLRLFVEYEKKTIGLTKDKGSNSTREDMATLVIKTLSAIVSSGMYIDVSIAPFKHHLGELEVQAKITNFIPPGAEFKINLYKMDNTLNKLKASRIFSPDTLKRISVILDRLTIKHENGDASILWQIKPLRPGVLFLNGRQVKHPLDIFKPAGAN